MTPEPTESTEPEAPVVTRTIRLPEDLWRKLRSVAALRGMSGNDALVEAARHWVSAAEARQQAGSEEV